MGTEEATECRVVGLLELGYTGCTIVPEGKGVGELPVSRAPVNREEEEEVVDVEFKVDIVELGGCRRDGDGVGCT